ncbi:hypothetical protein E3A20_13840 [Planctomyces bekefii]|uniref:Uncharacterized protein n=1 Tax=Planctomyces bekefii TaxID=1653850 RepID=A0A5C6M4H8_9PLAN|nr:hypothetical protein E3A20_13840 [Planctomyces bekefii]
MFNGIAFAMQDYDMYGLYRGSTDVNNQFYDYDRLGTTSVANKLATYRNGRESIFGTVGSVYKITHSVPLSNHSGP